MLRQECGLHPRVRRNIWKIFGRAFLTLCFIDIFLATVTQIWRLNEKAMNLKNTDIPELGVSFYSRFCFQLMLRTHQSIFFLDLGCHPVPVLHTSFFRQNPHINSAQFLHLTANLHLLIAYQEWVAASVTSHPKPMSKFERDADLVHFALQSK